MNWGPILLFEEKRDWSGYDVAADGRLLVAREANENGAGTQISIVLRWFEEMKQEQRK